MTSLQTSFKQVPTQGGCFVSLGNPAGAAGVLSYAPNPDNVTPGTFTQVTNGAASGTTFPLGVLGQISSLGAVYVDQGKTVVSSGRTFRKVRYNLADSVVTGGVAGPADSSSANGTALPGYFTFFLELANGGGTNTLKVARV